MNLVFLAALLACLLPGLLCRPGSPTKLIPQISLNITGSLGGRFHGENLFQGLAYDKDYNLTVTCAYDVPYDDMFTIFIQLYKIERRGLRCPFQSSREAKSSLAQHKPFVINKEESRRGVSMIAPVQPGRKYCIRCATNYGVRGGVTPQTKFMNLTTAVSDELFNVENMYVDISRIPGSSNYSVKVVGVDTYPSPIYTFNNCTSHRLSAAIARSPPSGFTGMLVLPMSALANDAWCLVTVETPGMTHSKNLTFTLAESSPETITKSIFVEENETGQYLVVVAIGIVVLVCVPLIFGVSVFTVKRAQMKRRQDSHIRAGTRADHTNLHDPQTHYLDDGYSSSFTSWTPLQGKCSRTWSDLDISRCQGSLLATRDGPPSADSHNTQVTLHFPLAEADTSGWTSSEQIPLPSFVESSDDEDAVAKDTDSDEKEDTDSDEKEDNNADEKKDNNEDEKEDEEEDYKIGSLSNEDNCAFPLISLRATSLNS